MKRLIPVLALLLACVLPAYGADIGFSGGSIGFGGGSGGGSSTTNNYLNTFAGANQAALTGLSGCSDVVVSPDGIYAYCVGILASNSDVAVVKLKISDGSIVATTDLAVAVTGVETAEIDRTGASLYVFSGVNYWKIDAAAMTITHTAAIVGGVTDNHKGWDLSPDGTKLVYVNSNTDQTIHLLNTSTYAVTNKTLGHSSGANTYAVGFLDDTNVYAAYINVSTIDQYTTAGAWVRAVDTTDANVKEIRAGLGGYLFILGSTQLETVDTGHTVTAYPNIPSPSSLAVDKGARALATSEDLAIVIGTNEDRAYILDGQYVGPLEVSFPAQAMWDGVGRVGIAQDGSGRGFICSERTPVPVLVSLNSDFSGFAGSGDNRDITSFSTTKPNTMTLSADGVALTIHGAGALQSANILTIDNLPFGGNFIIGPFGQLSTTYDISANRTLTAGTNLVVGPGGAYLAVDSTGAVIATAGLGVHLKSGANALVGTGTLSGGTLVVTTTAIDADDIVILTGTGGTVTNLGVIYEDKASRVNGTSFTVKSSNVLDTSDFSWVIQKVD